MKSEKYNKNNDPDYNYRQILAENLDCPAENLACVIGPVEFKNIIEKYTPDNFYTGDFLSANFEERYKNVLNKTFRINLHMHTQESDGIITPEELLSQSVLYAKSAKAKINDDLPAFTVSVTDHDSLEGTKQALKLIAESPEKYKDIKFVPGIEFSVSLDNLNILKRPVATDMMGYCINPYDKDLTDFLKKLKDSRYEEAQKIIYKLNNLGIPENWETVKNSHILIKNAASMAFFDFIKFYIFKKYKKTPAILRYKEKIENFFEDKQTDFSPTVREVADLLSTSFGYIGLAHPGRIHLSALDESKLTPTAGRNLRQECLNLLLKDSFSQGASLSESNYQYTMRHFKDELPGFIEIIQQACEEAGVLQTGGTDGHTAGIFTHQQALSKEELDYCLLLLS